MLTRISTRPYVATACSMIFSPSEKDLGFRDRATKANSWDVRGASSDTRCRDVTKDLRGGTARFRNVSRGPEALSGDRSRERGGPTLSEGGHL